MTESSGDRDPVEQLAESFLARYRRGERPSIDDYAAKFPDLAVDIRELLPALVALEQGISIDAPTSGEAFSGGSKAAATPDQLGDYLILREIGRGGMGVVYEATQESLGRHVALKVLPGACLGGTHLERFRLEARAAARLHHTNIVPVFGVGVSDGIHYYAMQFIQGQGLDVVIEELTRQRRAVAQVSPAAYGPRESVKPPVRVITECLIADSFVAATAGCASATLAGPDENSSSQPENGMAHSVTSSRSDLSLGSSEGHFYRAAARVALQVAQALGYAHGQGIVHRDIKPSNLLLDVKGNVWVTDFGLAKSEGTDGPTQTGDIVGTLRYMAPERFDGWSDPRSDVYALGATLYELLTLHTVYDESQRARLIDKVLHDSPIPPRKHDRKIPRDLETIVLKALSREPSARYSTAEAMAEDLRRFLADKPVLARRSSPAEKTWRWCRRNPVVASLVGLLIAVFLAAFVAVTFAWRSADASRVLADTRRIESERNEREAKRQKARVEAGVTKARGAVDEYLNKVADSQPLQAPGLESLRRDLLKSGLGFYQDFLKEHADDPGLRLLEADVQFRAAKIMTEIEPGPAAVAASEKSEALFEQLHRDRPDDDQVTAGLADVLTVRGKHYHAVGLLDPLVKRRPENTRYQRLLLMALNEIARVRSRADDPEETLKIYLRCFDIVQSLVRLEPEVAENHARMAATLNNIAIQLDAEPIFRGEDSLDLLRHALAHINHALALAPNDQRTARYILISRRNIARISFNVGFMDQGLKDYEAVVEFCRRLVTRNPESLTLLWDLYSTVTAKSTAEIESGQKDRAASTLEESLAILNRLEDRQLPGSPKCAQQKGWILARLAQLGSRGVRPPPVGTPDPSGTAAEAVASLKRAIELGDRDLRWLQTSSDLNYLRARPDFQALVARVEATVREEALAPPLRAIKEAAKTDGPKPRPSDAAPIFDEGIEAGDVHFAAGFLFMYQENFEEARRQLEQSQSEREALVRQHPSEARHRFRLAKVHQMLSELALRQARIVESDRELTVFRAQLESILKDHPQDRELAGLAGIAVWSLGLQRAGAGLWDDARDLLARAEAVGNPDFWVPRSCSRMYLEILFGERADYRKIAARGVEWYRGKDHTFWAADLAKMLALAPDAGVDTAEMVRMGEHGARTEEGGYHSWMTTFLGLEYYRAGRLNDAVRTLDRLADDPLMNDLALNVRAMIEFKLGHPVKARSYLAAARDAQRKMVHRALGGRPLDLPWFWMTWLEFRTLYREAETMVEGRPAREPWIPLFSARVEASRGRIAQAGALLDLVAREGSDDPELFAARSRVWSEIGRDAEALADVDRALALDAKNFQALCERGRIAIKQGRIDAGVADLLEALDQRPAIELGSFDERTRADILLAASQPAYTKAIALRPASVSLRRARVRYLAWHQRWTEAHAEMRLAKITPEFEEWHLRAALALAAGVVEDYRRVSKDMLALFGDTPNDDGARYIALRALTLTSNDLVDPDKLAAWGYQITQTHQRTVWFRHAWAFAALRAGKDDLAASQFVETIKQDRYWSGRPVNWLGLALIAARRDNVEEGRVWLAKAERWFHEQGRDPDAQARTFPPKVHEHEWVATFVLIREAREALATAETARASRAAISSPPR